MNSLSSLFFSGRLGLLAGGTALCLCAGSPSAEPGPAASSAPWQADLGNGHYRNPILYADYSDPDVVAVGEDYYMTASSFNASPGLPVLHSRDLVNWELIGHAVERNRPEAVFASPQHGNGIWAPNIRYHDDRLWIFYPDPDYGIYVTHTTDPRRGWSEPELILPGEGIIDPTPLWDDDGQAWLLHGWAKSRSGKNNILTLHRMAADASSVEPEGKVIINGHELPGYRTLEGPKFYKRNGYYYVFAPAGGVPVGWQSVFRARSIEGPYEARVVMEQGDTLTNGPHQGAWVSTPAGEDWFIHFQSRLPYGRIVHLQPMQWREGWPVIGLDPDGDGIGNPVASYRKPAVDDTVPVRNLPFSDDFSGQELALQWQWNANLQSDWYSLEAHPGHLRLFAQPQPEGAGNNLWHTPSLLLQKLPAPAFILETTLELPAQSPAMSAGLLMYGEDYAWIGIRRRADGGLEVGTASCRDARRGCEEVFHPEAILNARRVTLRMTVAEGGGTVFSYRTEQGRFRAIGELFQARPGRWVGAKAGLFARSGPGAEGGHVDVDDFNFFLADRLTGRE